MRDRRRHLSPPKYDYDYYLLLLFVLLLFVLLLLVLVLVVVVVVLLLPVLLLVRLLLLLLLFNSITIIIIIITTTNYYYYPPPPDLGGPPRSFGKGQLGSALMASLHIMSFDRETFWVLQLTYFCLSKSARAYLFPQSVKIHDFCSGHISVDRICPQPRYDIDLSLDRTRRGREGVDPM